MKYTELEEYEIYVSTVVNSRLIYNTIEEYEDKLEMYSLHTNGVHRCFNSLKKLRSTFRDFHVETLCLTHNQLDLQNILDEYQYAWTFYKKNLSRRRNPESIASELLNFSYRHKENTTLTIQKQLLFNAIDSNNINIPILFLLLLKVLPGFDSKEGNVSDIKTCFQKVISFLEDFTKGNTCFFILPAIIQAKEEPNKSRITLIYHTTRILSMYSAYSDSDSIYEQSSKMKQNIIDLDIDGYWIHSKSQADTTTFSHIEHALNSGTYFLTTWHKNSDNKLEGIKYSMNLSETIDGKLMLYLLHPLAIQKRIKALPYTDKENVWYQTDMPSINRPLHFTFVRMMNSNFWPQKINLTRVTDVKEITRYDKWLSICTKEIAYKNLEYLFIPNLYASTPDNLYIPKDDTTFYKIPRTASPGLENIQLGDLAGIMTLGDKEYIVFDDILLYIEINEEQLEKYGIKIVDSIK